MVCCTIPSIFLFSAIFQLKTIFLCENLVIKALTNLMAHFIFFAPNKLEPLCLYVVYACTYTLELAEPCYHGNVFNIALVLCTQLISCSFVYGCHRCEIKRELVSPWSLYPVLEKRLGH